MIIIIIVIIIIVIFANNLNFDALFSTQEICCFLDYLEEWDKMKIPYQFRFSASCHLGLVVTLKGTIEIVKYLAKDVEYKYLMTRRLNQDALEVQHQFFSNNLLKRNEQILNLKSFLIFSIFSGK